MSAATKPIPLREQLDTAVGQAEFAKKVTDPAFLAQLKALFLSPEWALRNLLAVQGQTESKIVSYDPDEASYSLQQDMIRYWANPPRNIDGYTKWFVALGPRQIGKSTVPELLGTHAVMSSPGWDHVCEADTDKRASYLHQRAQIAYAGCPAFLRPPQVSTKEVRQLTLRHGQTTSRLRSRTAGAEASGVGETPTSYHASEMGFWPNFAMSWTLTAPSFRNNKNARIIAECTPVPPAMASGEQWREFCQAARSAGPEDRLFYRFYPFWDSRVNARTWVSTWTLDSDEQNRMNKYGHLGLTKANLAFRRETIKTDEEIRKDPRLFDLWYPSDDLTCWISAGTGVIPENCLAKHLKSEDLIAWKGDETYIEYEEPQPGALYVIGVDPCGFAARDHAAFHVLKVWRGEWTQVAVLAGHIDPVTLSRKLEEVGLRYNKALIGIESNGVGQGPLTYLVQNNYPNLYYKAAGNPGLPSTGASQQGHLADLTTALMDELVLHDKETVEQLSTYKNDKTFEAAVSTEALHNATAIFSESGSGRRKKHHWDRVSALLIAVQMAKQVPQRFRPSEEAGGPGFLDASKRVRRRIDGENPSFADEIAKLTPQQRAVYDALRSRYQGGSTWGPRRGSRAWG